MGRVGTAAAVAADEDETTVEPGRMNVPAHRLDRVEIESLEGFAAEIEVLAGRQLGTDHGGIPIFPAGVRWRKITSLMAG